MDTLSLTIDRIILHDLDLSPDRAEQIRTLIQQELTSLLAQGGWPGGHMESTDIHRLSAPPVQLGEPHSDSRLAHGVARSIARGLQSSDRSRTQ